MANINRCGLDVWLRGQAAGLALNTCGGFVFAWCKHREVNAAAAAAAARQKKL